MGLGSGCDGKPWPQSPRAGSDSHRQGHAHDGSRRKDLDFSPFAALAPRFALANVAAAAKTEIVHARSGCGLATSIDSAVVRDAAANAAVIITRTAKNVAIHVARSQLDFTDCLSIKSSEFEHCLVEHLFNFSGNQSTNATETADCRTSANES